MSRSTEFTEKLGKNTLMGSPTGIAEISIDASTIGATEDVFIHDHFSKGGHLVSLQVVSDGLAGTLDGTVQLMESNDGENWANAESAALNLDTADQNEIVSQTFASAFIGARVTKGSLTGGIIKLIFVVKHK